MAITTSENDFFNRGVQYGWTMRGVREHAQEQAALNSQTRELGALGIDTKALAHGGPQGLLPMTPVVPVNPSSSRGNRNRGAAKSASR